MKTRMTELLGIKYPIMQGGMQHLGVPELACRIRSRRSWNHQCNYLSGSGRFKKGHQRSKGKNR